MRESLVLPFEFKYSEPFHITSSPLEHLLDSTLIRRLTRDWLATWLEAG